MEFCRTALVLKKSLLNAKLSLVRGACLPPVNRLRLVAAADTGSSSLFPRLDSASGGSNRKEFWKSSCKTRAVLTLLLPWFRSKSPCDLRAAPFPWS